MRDVFVVGIGMTPFGKFLGTSLRHLATDATTAALEDARLRPQDIQIAFFGNAMEGLLTGQEMITGQVALRDTGLCGLPIVNVENACASGSTAVHLCRMAIASGSAEIALAVGAEKLTHADKARSFEALGTAVDLERLPALEAELYAEGKPEGHRSFFMDLYSDQARRYSEATGARASDFAQVAVKNHKHGALNPRAQYREEVSVDQVLSSRTISGVLTLLMCSPIGDGAAALVLCSGEVVERFRSPSIRIKATALVSGSYEPSESSAVRRASELAYEEAGIGPEDLDVIELHDAAAPAELVIYEELGLCNYGDAPALLACGATSLGGRIPVNTSGGLLSKGHPVGATGCAQLVELTEQLRGSSGPRQVNGARVALAENNGGYLGPDAAAACVTILSR